MTPIIKAYKEEFLYFFKDKVFILLMILSAIAAYGYQLTHSSLGVDDICINYYFSEGLGLVVGRWPFFVLTKWFGLDGLTKFIPFFTDYIAVILLLVGAVTWLVFIKVSAKESGIVLRKLDYIIFGCLFTTFSLIAQVWIYYLHNGIAIGYLLIGLSLLILEGDFSNNYDYKHLFNNIVRAALLVCIASGFYESMMVVFLFGVGLYLLIYYYKKTNVNFKHICYVISKSVIVLGVAFVFRYITIQALTVAYGFTTCVRQPSLIAVTYFLKNIGTIISGTICDYLLLPEYQPIRLFMICSLFGMFFLIVDAIKKRRIRLIIIAMIVFLSMFSITPFMHEVIPYKTVQNSSVWQAFDNHTPMVLPYRTMQVLSIYVAFIMMVFVHKYCHNIDCSKKYKVIRLIPYMIISLLLWNNYCEINYDFYMEYENNQYSMRKIDGIGHELERMGYDENNEIVLFVCKEKDKLPYPTTQDMITDGGIWDSVRNRVCKLFYAKNHVKNAIYYQVLTDDVAEWAVTSFGSQYQMKNLLQRRGYFINLYEGNVEAIVTDEDIDNMAVYPEDGFIKKVGNVLVVKVK